MGFIGHAGACQQAGEPFLTTEGQGMQDYCCYFLNDGGQREFSANIGADSLQSALQHCFAILEASGSSLPNPPRAIEIWEGEIMLFRS